MSIPNPCPHILTASEHLQGWSLQCFTTFSMEKFSPISHLNLPWSNSHFLSSCPLSLGEETWLSPPVRELIFCDISQPSHRCSPKFLARLWIFSSETPSLAGWKSQSAWGLSLSINTHSVKSKQSIFTYPLRVFPSPSLDSNNFPSRDAKKKIKKKQTRTRRFYTKFH